MVNIGYAQHFHIYLSFGQISYSGGKNVNPTNQSPPPAATTVSRTKTPPFRHAWQMMPDLPALLCFLQFSINVFLRQWSFFWRWARTRADPLCSWFENYIIGNTSTLFLWTLYNQKEIFKIYSSILCSTEYKTSWPAFVIQQFRKLLLNDKSG